MYLRTVGDIKGTQEIGFLFCFHSSIFSTISSINCELFRKFNYLRDTEALCCNGSMQGSTNRAEWVRFPSTSSAVLDRLANLW